MQLLLLPHNFGFMVEIVYKLYVFIIFIAVKVSASDHKTKRNETERNVTFFSEC